MCAELGKGDVFLECGALTTVDEISVWVKFCDIKEELRCPESMTSNKAFMIETLTRNSKGPN